MAKTLSVKLPDPDQELLRRAAYKARCNESVFTRQAIAALAHHHGVTRPRGATAVPACAKAVQS